MENRYCPEYKQFIWPEWESHVICKNKTVQYWGNLLHDCRGVVLYTTKVSCHTNDISSKTFKGVVNGVVAWRRKVKLAISIIWEHHKVNYSETQQTTLYFMS